MAKKGAKKWVFRCNQQKSGVVDDSISLNLPNALHQH